jgi:hypothetical protein
MNTSNRHSALNQLIRVPLLALRLLILIPSIAMAWLMLRRNIDPVPVAATTDPLITTTPTLEFSVVIPFYNPGDTMRPTVQRLVDILRQRETSFEVIAVSDGSTDGSEHSLADIGSEVRVIVSPKNLGKGAALHRGFAQAQGEYVGFVDADGDIDPKNLASYLDRAQAGGHEVVFASKRHPDSVSHATAIRKFISLGFITLVKTLFALPICDTQTGCKVFRRDALARTLPQLREQRFAFDLEFFVAARAAGVLDMVPAPVELQERMAGSSVSRGTVVRTLIDALTVFGRLHLTSAYTPTALPQPVPVAVEAKVIPFPALNTVPQSITELKAA